MEHIVAVYGSLKRGYGNHPVMSRASGQYISDAVSTDDHYILDGHGFPYINEDPHNAHKGHLSVELYKVPFKGLQGPLDSLEGHPFMYKRAKRKFKTPSGEILEAWVYIYNRQITPNTKYLKDNIYIW